MKKYLVYFNNGLWDTNLMLIAKNKKEAEQMFKTDCESDADFIMHNCIGGKCRFLYVKELVKREGETK